MKATVNGVTYEGTYDEIAAIVDRMTPKCGCKQGIHALGDSLKNIEEMKRKLNNALDWG